MRIVIACLIVAALNGCATRKVFYNDQGESIECKHYVMGWYDVGSTEQQMQDCERAARAKGFNKI